jgi:Uncharacterised protein (DUF2406)
MSEFNSNEVRPRPHSVLSYESKKSRRSSTSGPKLELTETSKEKEKNRLHTKADPSLAINEAQPCMLSAYLVFDREADRDSCCRTRAIEPGKHSENDLAGPARERNWYAIISTTMGTPQNSRISIAADPDRSNPTRNRMERPLDTIRSFEAAVEGTYNSRRSTFSGRPGTLDCWREVESTTLIAWQHLK